MTMTWEELERDCERCTGCELYRTKTKTVLGCGNRNARLMFVGEAPGEQEDAAGIPFVGRAGQLLDRYLTAVDIDRNEVYIANILKCRPPNNRDPLPEEEDCCMRWLREQVKLIRPRLIVCLGRIAAIRMIRPDFRITREHGIWVEKGDFLITAVYHPSALLRDESKRGEMLADMKIIKERLDQCSAAAALLGNG